jgi:PAS domain S-box-containing protein
MNTVAVQPRVLSSFQFVGATAWPLYVAAVALPVLTLLLRLAIWDYVPGLPFVTFIPSICVLAVLGSVRPAIIAALLSAVLGFTYLTTTSPFGPGSQAVWSCFGYYVLVCGMLIGSTYQVARATKVRAAWEAGQAAARESALRAQLSAAKAEAAQTKVERQLVVLADALPVMISQVSRDLRYQFGNRTYQDWFGWSPEVLKGRHLMDVLGAEVFRKIKPHIDKVLSGQSVTYEDRLPYATGERHVRVHYVPNVGAEGEVEGYFALVEDVTAFHAQAELLAERERHIRAVLESVTDCFYAVDVDWRITLVNQAAETYFGRTRDDLMKRSLWDAFPELAGTRAEANLRHVMETREPVTFEAMSALHKGHYKEIRVSPKSGGGLAVSFSNITGRKQAERHRELLVNELNHRVKNTLAVVQSIAAKTFRGALAAPSARQAFEGRLMALAAAHDLLTQENWDAAKLGTLVRSALRPFAAEDRLVISGPDLPVRPQAAVSLTLALHELATNAAKYGALSNQTGVVTVKWTVSQRDIPTFRMVWQESGGPEVTPPATFGFGSRLIKQGLSGELAGPVSLSYLSDGLVCTVEAPVANLLEP